MADYDRAELERLQAEAAAKIREMHARAQPPAQTPSASAPPAPSNASHCGDSLPPMPSFVKVPYGRQEPRREERQGERRFEPMPERSEPQARRSPAPAPQQGMNGRNGGHAGGQPSERNVPPAHRQERPSPGPRRTGMDLMQMLNFKNIDLDGDRTLVLLLILLLSGEENDQYLTLALLYLLL